MRKKSGLTIVEKAIALVPEFENVVRKLDQQVALRGQSNSFVIVTLADFKPYFPDN
jgi:integrase/recombinase XerD